MIHRTFRFCALLALGALVLAGFTPAQAQQGFIPPGFERAAAAQDFHSDDLASIEGVVGVGLGVSPSGEPALLVLTEDLGVSGIPRRLDGVPVIVKVSGKVFARPKPNCSLDPSHPSCGGGGDTSDKFDRTFIIYCNSHIRILPHKICEMTFPTFPFCMAIKVGAVNPFDEAQPCDFYILPVLLSVYLHRVAMSKIKPTDTTST